MDSRLRDELRAAIAEAQRQRPADTVDQRVAEILDIRTRGIPDEIADEIARSLLTPFKAKVAALIRSGRDAELFGLLDELDDAAMALVMRERQSGRLTPHTPKSQVNKWLSALQVCAYNATELDHLLATLGIDESITDVGFHVITTSKRTISRDFLRSDAFRPPSWSNSTSWAAQFASDAEIRALETGVASNVEVAAGHDSFNRDYPRGVRP